MPEDQGSWDSYQKLVLAELHRFDKDIQAIKSTQSDILSEIAVLKMKAGVWGALSGLLTALGAGVLYYLGLDRHTK